MTTITISNISKEAAYTGCAEFKFRWDLETVGGVSWNNQQSRYRYRIHFPDSPAFLYL